MEQEYATSIYFKIIYGLVAVGLFSVSIYFFVISLLHGHVVWVLPLIGIIAATLIAVNLYKRKIIITNDSITYISVWSSKELLMVDIKGYRTTKNTIYIYPVSRSYRKISINDNWSLENTDAIFDWFRKTLIDLDIADIEAEKKQIFRDIKIGSTEAERQDKYENAVIFAISYNIVGVVLFILSRMLRIEHVILTWVLLIYPLLGLVLIFYTRGLIRIFARLSSSAYRSIYLGLFITEACLISQPLTEVNLIGHGNLCMLATIVSVLFFSLLLIITLKYAKTDIITQLILIGIASAGYGFGSVLEANYSFDESKEKMSPAIVISRFSSQGNTLPYNMAIKELPPNYEIDYISAPDYLYEDKQIGDTVVIHFKQGFLNIPFYMVSKH